MIKKFVFLLCMSFIVRSHVTQGQQMSVLPTVIDMQVPIGGIGTKAVILTNTSSKKQGYNLSLSDWVRDSIGGHKYLPINTISQSCAKWITLSHNFIEIEPNSSAEVTITMKAPESKVEYDGTRWAMLFVQNALEQESTNNSKNKKTVSAQIREIFKLGIHIYQTPPNTILKEAKAVSLAIGKKQQNTWDFTIENTGALMINCTTRLEFTNVANGELFKSTNVEFPVFPGFKRIATIPIPEQLPKGEYSMIAILDYGDDKPLEAIEKMYKKD